MSYHRKASCSNAPETSERESHHNLVERLWDQSPIIGEYPLNIQIQTVSACNAKCKFCPYQGSWHHKNPGRMRRHVYEKIILNLKRFNVRKFCPYLENEPLLDREIFDKIRFAIEHLSPKCIELSTNLSVLNNEILKEIEAVFPGIPHEFRISFHGVDEHTYEEIMGLDFHRTMENVRAVVELSQSVPLDIFIRGAGSPMRQRNGTKNWFGRDVYTHFWENELSTFDRKPTIEFFTYHDRAGQKQLTEKAMSDGSIVRDDLRNFYCIRFDRWIHFLYTGEPIMCCMDYNRETALGRVIEEMSIEDLYNTEHFRTLISKGTGMIDSEKDFICKRCISPGG
jgi:sulfatase maturation enzyme AslB (radical SAM superfamily)